MEKIRFVQIKFSTKNFRQKIFDKTSSTRISSFQMQPRFRIIMFGKLFEYFNLDSSQQHIAVSEIYIHWGPYKSTSLPPPRSIPPTWSWTSARCMPTLLVTWVYSLYRWNGGINRQSPIFSLVTKKHLWTKNKYTLNKKPRKILSEILFLMSVLWPVFKFHEKYVCRAKGLLLVKCCENEMIKVTLQLGHLPIDSANQQKNIHKFTIKEQLSNEALYLV